MGDTEDADGSWFDGTDASAFVEYFRQATEATTREEIVVRTVPEAVGTAIARQAAGTSGVGVAFTPADPSARPYVQWVCNADEGAVDLTWRIEVSVQPPSEDMEQLLATRGYAADPELVDFNIWVDPKREFSTDEAMADYLVVLLRDLGAADDSDLTVYP